MSVGFGIDTGYHSVESSDDDVVNAIQYAVLEVFGTPLTTKIVSARKKVAEGTLYQIVTGVSNAGKTICKVMIFNIADKYGELYVDNYDTLFDGSC